MHGDDVWLMPRMCLCCFFKHESGASLHQGRLASTSCLPENSRNLSQLRQRARATEYENGMNKRALMLTQNKLIKTQNKLTFLQLQTPDSELKSSRRRDQYNFAAAVASDLSTFQLPDSENKCHVEELGFGTR